MRRKVYKLYISKEDPTLLPNGYIVFNPLSPFTGWFEKAALYKCEKYELKDVICKNNWCKVEDWHYFVDKIARSEYVNV